MAKRDYYEILGVKKTASADEIKKAFRSLAQICHPDKNPGDTAAEERFKDINEAYAVLSDPKKRRQYDNIGAEGFHQQFSQEDIFRDFDLNSIFSDLGVGRGGGADDLFSSLFGGRGRRRPQRGANPFVDLGSFGGAGPCHGGGQPTRGQDYRQVVEISLHEAVYGGNRRLSIYPADSGADPGARQDLNVRIPPGVTDGKRLRLAGKGGPPQGPGGPPGDLFLEIRVASHPTFKLEGRDLVVEQTVSLTQAILGDQVAVPTLRGETKQLRVPPGTQSGTRLRMRGLGVPAHKGESAGDQHVVLKVQIPRELTDEQRQMIEKLRHSGL